MGVHAGQLALKSDLRLVQEYRRSLLPCLEQARRPTLDHHVYRSSGLGVWVLISENWYEPFGTGVTRESNRARARPLRPKPDLGYNPTIAMRESAALRIAQVPAIRAASQLMRSSDVSEQAKP